MTASCFCLAAWKSASMVFLTYAAMSSNRSRLSCGEVCSGWIFLLRCCDAYAR
jgi:hypothetical protein